MKVEEYHKLMRLIKLPSVNLSQVEFSTKSTEFTSSTTLNILTSVIERYKDMVCFLISLERKKRYKAMWDVFLLWMAIKSRV